MDIALRNAPTDFIKTNSPKFVTLVFIIVILVRKEMINLVVKVVKKEVNIIYKKLLVNYSAIFHISKIHNYNSVKNVILLV